MVKAPALPPPPLPAITGRLPQGLNTARLLVTVTVFDGQVSSPKPLGVVQTQLTWPTQKTCSLPLDFLDYHCNYRLEVPNVQIGEPTPLSEWAESRGFHVSRGPQIQVVCMQDLIVAGSDPYLYVVATTGGPAATGRQVFLRATGRLETRDMRGNPLSLTHPAPQHYFVTSVFTVLRPDDPLRNVHLLDFLPPLSVHSRYTKEQYSHPYQLYLPEYLYEDVPGTAAHLGYRYLAPGGLGLLRHLGLTSLLLIAAAVLLAQVFRRRDLAMAGLLLAMVLFVAGWDRGTLAYDLARLNDPAAPLSVRLAGCCRADQTFFYGRTARNAVRYVKDHATGNLKDCAAVSNDVLDKVVSQ